MIRPGAIMLIAALTLTACAGRPPLTSNAGLTVTNFDALPPPTRADFLSPQRPYLIGPYDRLSVSVFGVPELSVTVQADSGGRISLPLAGELEASGRTPRELETLIEERLQQYVRTPDATVNLEETRSQVVTVDGEVEEPGLYPVVGRMTLMQAIALAKGTSDIAALDDVVVFRNVGNQRMAALYNLTAIRRGIYGDPEIYANDVVVVGDSPQRRLFRDILQASPLLTAPLIAILQR